MTNVIDASPSGINMAEKPAKAPRKKRKPQPSTKTPEEKETIINEFFFSLPLTDRIRLLNELKDGVSKQIIELREESAKMVAIADELDQQFK